MSTQSFVSSFTIGCAVGLVCGCSATTDISGEDPGLGGQALTGAFDRDIGFDAAVACERQCGYAEECGTGGMPIPGLACACVGSECDCETPDVCLAKCLDDLNFVDERGTHCATAVRRTLACLQTVQCAPLKDVAGEAWFDASGCDGVAVPEDVQAACPGSGRGSGSESQGLSGCSAAGTALAEDQAAGGEVTVAHCEVQLSCSDSKYELSCERKDPSTNGYQCTCRRGGVQTSQYEVVNGCGWQNDGSLGSPEALIESRCHWANTP